MKQKPRIRIEWLNRPGSKRMPTGYHEVMRVDGPHGCFHGSYWDLWFLLVAADDYRGKLGALAGHLRDRRHSGRLGELEGKGRKLAHLRDLQRRLAAAGLCSGDIGPLLGSIGRTERSRARSRVLLHKERIYERSIAMVSSLTGMGKARARRGLWHEFPVSPREYEPEIIQALKPGRLYSKDDSFDKSGAIDRWTERGKSLKRRGETANAMALLRALLAVSLDLLDTADDSCGMIGVSFGHALELYLRCPFAKTAIEEEAFLGDLLEFLIWEDYGLTDRAIEGYWRKRHRRQAEFCDRWLRRRIRHLRGWDLDDQAEEAMALLARVVAEKRLFEGFEEIARKLKPGHWQFLLLLAKEAADRGRQSLALTILEIGIDRGGPAKEILAEERRNVQRGRGVSRSR